MEEEEEGEPTRVEVKAFLLLRVVFHLTGEVVEFSWWPIRRREERWQRGGKEGERGGGGGGCNRMSTDTQEKQHRVKKVDRR